MRLLVIEASTSSAKALVYDTAQHKTEFRQRPYGKYNAVRNANATLTETLACAREALDGQKADAIAISSTFHSLLLCDANIEPASPLYQWSYSGSSALCEKLRKNRSLTRWYYSRTGCMVNAIYPAFKLMHLKSLGQSLAGRYALGMGDYLFYSLTGTLAVTDSMASGTGLFNMAKRAYDMGVLKKLGLSEISLPEISNWRNAATLSSSGAALLGLSAGIPVLPACPDGGLNQTASGGDGIMTLSVGTSGALRFSVPAPALSPDCSTWCYLSPDGFMSGAATSGCCNCVDWAKNAFFGPDAPYPDHDADFFEGREDAPIFLPFLYGERCPGWNDGRRGDFRGLNASHTSADFYYSVLEGVLFNLYQCYLKLVAINGKPREIRLSGGILNSPGWMQMCADILGAPITPDGIKHGSLAGGLKLLSAYTGGEWPQPESGKTINPNKVRRRALMDRYKIYLENYGKW